MQYIISKVLIITFLLFHFPAHPQPEYFNTKDFWSKLQYDTTPLKLTTNDTAIVVVSNRKRTKDTLRFMSEYPTENELLYFVVYCKKGNWHVKPMNNLATSIKAIPNKDKDWVIYTEGMGKLFTTELDRGISMTSQYDVNVIMLDYPSITTTKKTAGNYLFAVKQSKATYKYFSPTIAEIKSLYTGNKMGEGNISFFFHSMGNNLAKQMVKRGVIHSYNDKVWVDNIILNAACVPQSGHRKWLEQLTFAKNIYINYNPNDFVLGAAHFVSKRKQLGEKVKNPISSKANYINFSKMVGEQHSYFLELKGHNNVSEEVHQHYNTILHGNVLNFQSENYQKTDYRNIGWNIVPQHSKP